MPSRALHLLLLSTICFACTRAERVGDAAADAELHEDSSAGIIVPASQPYAVVPLELTGRVTGTIAESDSGAAPYLNGDEVIDCPVPVKAASNGGPPPVVVWVDGIAAGKPLPDNRRYVLTSEGCGLEPRVQPVVAGGTLNIYNKDRAGHTLVFMRQGTNDTLQVMQFTHGGQLVPTQRLTTRAGVVEVHCLEHPAMRAYIAVFDHPYFAMTSGGKPFTIDSLPPGDHAVRSWYAGEPRPLEQRVSVAGGGEETISIQQVDR